LIPSGDFSSPTSKHYCGFYLLEWWLHDSFSNSDFMFISSENWFLKVASLGIMDMKLIVSVWSVMLHETWRNGHRKYFRNGPSPRMRIRMRCDCGSIWCSGAGLRRTASNKMSRKRFFPEMATAAATFDRKFTFACPIWTFHKPHDRTWGIKDFSEPIEDCTSKIAQSRWQKRHDDRSERSDFWQSFEYCHR
jgi:hypothetical protein